MSMQTRVSLVALTAALTIAGASAATEPLVVNSGFTDPAFVNCKSDPCDFNQAGGRQAARPLQRQTVIAAGLQAAAEVLTRWSEPPTDIEEAIDTRRCGFEAKEAAPEAALPCLYQQVRDLGAELASPQTTQAFHHPDTENGVQ